MLNRLTIAVHAMGLGVQYLRLVMLTTVYITKVDYAGQMIQIMTVRLSVDEANKKSQLETRICTPSNLKS